MTDDSVFRTKVESTPQPEPVAEAPKPSEPVPSPVSDNTIEVPYTDYENAHSKPFAVDFFDLGDNWNSAEGGFSKEVAVIEEYFSKKIKTGELENSVKVIREKLKSIEKIANTHEDSRKTIRLGTISAYIEFLMKTDKVMYNARRYQ